MNPAPPVTRIFTRGPRLPSTSCSDMVANSSDRSSAVVGHSVRWHVRELEIRRGRRVFRESVRLQEEIVDGAAKGSVVEAGVDLVATLTAEQSQGLSGSAKTHE